MSFTAMTKPDQGDATKKSFADTVIDNLNDLNSRISAAATVLNGSFETDGDADGIPDSWTRTLFTGGTFLHDDTDQRHGLYAVKFTSPGGGGNGGGRIESTDAFPVSPLRQFRVSWEMKSSAAAVSNLVEVYWFKEDLTASATPNTMLYSSSTANPTSWTSYSEVATPPSDARFAKIRLTGCSTASTTAGSTWFDNVFVEQIAHQRIWTFNASGTWTCPPGIYRVQVECWGGGGGGAKAAASARTGGGSGSYSTGNYNVTPGVNYTVTVGAAGGAGGSGIPSGDTGGDGGTTSFGSTFLTAIGGAGGNPTSGGGTGGAAGTGADFTIVGSNAAADGNGAAAPRGGAGGAVNSGAGVGGSGTAPGGGGGNSTDGASNGGAGGAGRVTVFAFM